MVSLIDWRVKTAALVRQVIDGKETGSDMEPVSMLTISGLS